MALARRIIALIGLALGATVLRAQTPTHVDATRLVAGQFVYQTVLEHEINGTPLGTRTVSVSPTNYGGVPAWLLVESRIGDAVPAVDSLVADLTSLRPVHWGSTIARARLSAEFRGDTVYGGTSAPAGRKSLVAALPPGALINAPMLETVLRLLPLRTAWEDSATMVSVALNGVSTMPTRIAVIGEDNVRVPAGQFDCWVVSVRAGDVTRGMYWVTKHDPMVVRSALDVPSMGGAQYVSSLVRFSR